MRRGPSSAEMQTARESAQAAGPGDEAQALAYLAGRDRTGNGRGITAAGLAQALDWWTDGGSRAYGAHCGTPDTGRALRALRRLERAGRAAQTPSAAGVRWRAA